MIERTALFEQLKRGPAWLQAPLRAGWRLLLRLRARLLSLLAWARIRTQRTWNIGGQGLRTALVAVRRVARRLLPRQPEKRILGIYHFQEHAGFLGDMMEYLEVLNVLRAQHGVPKIDLCYVDDPSNPNRPISRNRLETSPEFKPMMLQLGALLPGTGAVLQFDSDIDFEAFFRRNYRRYVCWPRYGYFHSWPTQIEYTETIPETGYPYPNTYAPLDRFLQTHAALPGLTCPPAALEWARLFIRRHAGAATPVTAQIRFNPESPRRNTDLDAWREFFQRMQARPDIKFIVICRQEEVTPELRALSNVVYAKDYGSGILEDLALIQVSHFSIFPDAGFATYPWFLGLPTIFFAKEKHYFPHLRMLDVNGGTGLRFLTPFQRRVFGEYTADTLEQEFLRLWNDLTAVGWTNPQLR